MVMCNCIVSEIFDDLPFYIYHPELRKFVLMVQTDKMANPYQGLLTKNIRFLKSRACFFTIFWN